MPTYSRLLAICLQIPCPPPRSLFPALYLSEISAEGAGERKKKGGRSLLFLSLCSPLLLSQFFSQSGCGGLQPAFESVSRLFQNICVPTK